MWTHEDLTFDTLPNITVTAALLDGEIKYYQLYPAEGYRILVAVAGTESEPYYMDGGAMVYDYDFETNELGFEAVLAEETETDTETE